MKQMKLHAGIPGVFALVLLLAPAFDAQADWQQTLESRFDRVETFDELQDWGANGLYPSGAGGTVPYDLRLLPKKLDGSPSIWGYWNNKAPTAIVGAISNGPFVTGETIGNGKGALLKFQKTHVIEGVTYVQMGWITGSVGTFQVGDRLVGQTSGASAYLTGWPKIIANHGSHTWRGGGKSLLMNLGDNDNTLALAGVGAQRLGTFFGDGISGKSGFKRMHVFMMVKLAPKFFGASGAPTDVNYISVFKFFDLCSGFTSIKRYGSDAEQPYIEQNPQTAVEYGANSSIINLFGGGASTPGMVYLNENIANATVTPNSSPVTYYEHVTRQLSMRNNDPAYPASGTEVNKVYGTQAAGEWFGLEIMSDIGTVDKADGATELWIYDKNGVVKGHYVATGVLKLVHFDHYYNKITLGGNRRTGTASSNLDGRYWVDDFIVHGSRIGPTYFQLLGGAQPGPLPETDTAAPTAAITAPLANATVSGVTPVAVNASDNVGVSKVELHVDGVLRGSAASGPFSWDTRAHADGLHQLVIKAYDAAGNVGASAAVAVTVRNAVASVDSVAPVVSLSMPATATSRTVAVTLSATDAVGVTGYLISESSLPPVAGAAGWLTTRPTSFTFAGAGTRTAYAWAKDAAGNVSAAASARVIITLPDTTLPVVTGFTLPATSKTLTVPVSAFTASDNIGVRGFLVTQSATRPLAGASGWSATPPTSVTFSATGIRTAYAWVKDAAGNVSAYRSATVIVDGTAPVITSYAPIGGATFWLGATVKVTGTATDAIALSHMRVSVDGAYRATASGGAITYYWKPASRGSHVIRVIAYDKAGNVSVKTAYVTVK